MKKFISVMLVLACALSLVACGSKTTETKKTEIRVLHCCGDGSPYDVGADKFKELVEEKLGDKYTVTVHPGDMSGDEQEIAEMAQNNNIEIAWIGTGALSGYVSELGIFELPFLFESEEHVNAALTGDFGNAMLEKLSAVEGVVGLGFHEDGWRNILTKDVVVNTVEDMQGVTMRCMQNEVCIAMYEALGSTPVSLPSSEQFSGIQNGVVQGTDNSAMYAVADGYIEVVNCICDIHHFYSSGIIVASQTWFEGLPAEDQEIIAACAQEAGIYQRAEFLAQDEAYISEYEAKGYTVTRPTDIDAWKAATACVYDEMYAKYPEWEAMVEKIKAAAN